MFGIDKKAEKRVCGSCRIGHGAAVAFGANDAIDELGRGMVPTKACIVPFAVATGTLQDPTDLASGEVATEFVSRIEVFGGAVTSIHIQPAYIVPGEVATRLLSDGA